jgi:hypothetical protein
MESFAYFYSGYLVYSKSARTATGKASLLSINHDKAPMLFSTTTLERR